MREAGFWRLVSHLSLGHLSVTGGAEGAAALKEVLRLYDLRDTAETRAAIEALTGITAGTRHRPRARPRRRILPRPRCHPGIRSRTWQAGGLYLLAAVLERFLALHGTVNSFTRTRATLRGRPATAAAWPARSGTRVLA